MVTPHAVLTVYFGRKVILRNNNLLVSYSLTIVYFQSKGQFELLRKKFMKSWKVITDRRVKVEIRFVFSICKFLNNLFMKTIPIEIDISDSMIFSVFIPRDTVNLNLCLRKQIHLANLIIYTDGMSPASLIHLDSCNWRYFVFFWSQSNSFGKGNTEHADLRIRGLSHRFIWYIISWCSENDNRVFHNHTKLVMS